MFSKREYEYVMEIAKEGSFSKAAQKLYISQPSPRRRDQEDREAVIWNRSL